MQTKANLPAEQIHIENPRRHGQTDKLVRSVRRVCHAPHRLAWRLIQFWYVLRIAVRSFHGHTSELLARKHLGADLGFLFQQSEAGHLAPNKRTESRNAGIEQLILLRPWTTSVDWEVFLQGFDWGEQFALRTNTQVHTSVEMETSATSGHSR